MYLMPEAGRLRVGEKPRMLQGLGIFAYPAPGKVGNQCDPFI